MGSKRAKPLPTSSSDVIVPFDFVSDTHAPYQEDACVALAAAFVRDHQQGSKGLLIFGGDMCDVVTGSKFKRLGTGVQNLEQEIIATRERVLKPFCKVTPNSSKVFLEGNHEFRLKRFVAYNAPLFENLKGVTSMGDALQLEELGIKYIDSKNGNAIYRVTPFLTFMHGERYGVNAAKSQYDAWGTSVMFGHTHKQTTFTKKWGCGREDISMSVGCLSKDPDYRDIDDYTRGFGSGWINMTSGEFFMQHIPIVRTKTNDWHLYSNQGNYKAILNSRTRLYDVERSAVRYQSGDHR